MEKAMLSIMALTILCLVGVCKALESPNYTVIHSESDFEIRLYKNSAWMTAPVNDNSFQKATRNGFNRLFQFIEGANLNSARASMTKPVLTSVILSSAKDVRFYMPLKFQGSPPLPLPELNLKADSWTRRCVAVRKFSGYATDSNVLDEAEKLAASLSKSSWAKLTSGSKSSFSIAQYNSPFRLIGRLNEVWVDVNGCNI